MLPRLKKMRIPRKVKILGQTYTVHYKKEMEDDMGECDYVNNKITLLRGMTDEKTMQTFLHELIHAVEKSMNINLKEDQVDNLSLGLYQILKENNISFKYNSKVKK